MQIAKQTAKAKTGGFTLVEMIGVLAIIAILTSLLIPKIFQVINDAKISNALVTYNSVKAAAAAHYGKWGGFRKADGTAYDSADYPVGNWDQVLISGGYLETPFSVKIGNGLQGDTADDGLVDASADGAFVRIIDISSLTTSDTVTAGDEDDSGTYRLATATAGGTAGESNPAVDVTGSYLVEAVIPGVALEDAKELNRRIDGSATGFGSQTWDTGSNARTADYTGRCKWELESGGDVTVYLYVAHR